MLKRNTRFSERESAGTARKRSEPKGRRILIVRHAQSAANAGGRTLDPATIPLTELGRRQAECVANVVCRPALIAVSSFTRTRETAQPLVARCDGIRVETWNIQEFTYLDRSACAGTSYAERKQLRDEYWRRRDVMHVDGPGCESFAGFLERACGLKGRLIAEDGKGDVVVFTHGLLMRALVWLQQRIPGVIDSEAMGEFECFCRRVSVPNCAILKAAVDDHGRIEICDRVCVEHLPAGLRTE